MAYEPRPDTGSLFKNKTDNEKAPQYKGDMILSGNLVAELAKLINSGQPAKLQVAAWVKGGKNGEKFLSLSFQSAIFKPSEGAVRQPKKQVDPNDDLPF